ncbi:MAG: P-loop NTPase [Bacteroidales bacterium]
MVKIAIASGKGGTGKTFVSTNLYQSLLKRGANVSLTDCDAEEPNAAAFFNIS